MCEKHLSLLLQFRDILAERFPNDHVSSPDAFASVKMHTHLFRYFSGLPGAAKLRARLNMVRKLQGKEPFILDRADAYIGTLIDDLVT